MFVIVVTAYECHEHCPEPSKTSMLFRSSLEMCGWYYEYLADTMGCRSATRCPLAPICLYCISLDLNYRKNLHTFGGMLEGKADDVVGRTQFWLL
jgi:hypothetical protein